MIKIQTPSPKGSIEIQKTDTALLKRLQNLLPYGVFPLDQTFNGADYGIVMQCGTQEVHCLKQQPLEVEREQAEELFQIQHWKIMDAYCRYIKMGFSGAYLASPYLRQRDNGLWEAGVAHFIFPSKKLICLSKNPLHNQYDSIFGKGATNMFWAFTNCLGEALGGKQSFKYLGLDIRTRSHLQNLAMYFMVLDSDVFCLRANLRGQEDAVAWGLLAEGGINKVYHLPSAPMTINESDLNKAKGEI